jgi:succinyl-CoA synthetase beta subunit
MILAENEAEDFLGRQGFPVAKKMIAMDKSQFENALKIIGYPCVIKVSSASATHKALIGGIKIIYSPDEISNIFERFMGIAKKVDGKILIQKFISGKELFLGLKKDAVFGDVMLVGIGGGFAESIHDVSFKILSAKFGKNDAINMLKNLKNFKSLEGCNLDAVSEIIAKLAMMPKRFPEIKELDINPLIIDEKKAVVVDARMIRRK